MPTRPDPAAKLSARQAKSPEVAALFETLTQRAEILARMQDEFLENIQARKAAKTGKPFDYTKSQKKFLDEADRDAEKAIEDMRRFIEKMEDRALLVSALSSEDQGVQFDERMLPAYPKKHQADAEKILAFRKETIRIIEEFVLNSPFKGQVKSLFRKK